MNKLTLGDHTFPTTGLHPEALRLMEFIIEHLTDLSTNPRTAGFDDKHLGIMADILGQYAAMQTFIKDQKSSIYIVEPVTDQSQL